MAWGLLGVFTLVSALCCCVGYKKYVYFLSIGYGFSVIGLGIAYFVTALVKGFAWNWVTLLQCLLFVVYGARLSGFLLMREIKNASYRKVLKEATGEDKKPMPIFVSVAIWLCVSPLYVAQTCPVFYRLYNGQGAEVALPLIGAIISLCGILLEAASDQQKSVQKKVQPNMVATQGLFKLCRCPNYLGEIIFWTGVMVGACNALKGAGQWIIALVGYVLIVAIMFNGAQRLEKRQNSRYGQDKAYQEYVSKTPILIPFVPLYHLNKK